MKTEDTWTPEIRYSIFQRAIVIERAILDHLQGESINFQGVKKLASEIVELAREETHNDPSN